MHHNAPLYYTLQHTATHCNALQHTVTYEHMQILVSLSQRVLTTRSSITHCNTLQHTVIYEDMQILVSFSQRVLTTSETKSFIGHCSGYAHIKSLSTRRKQTWRGYALVVKSLSTHYCTHQFLILCCLPPPRPCVSPSLSPLNNKGACGPREFVPSWWGGGRQRKEDQKRGKSCVYICIYIHIYMCVCVCVCVWNKLLCLLTAQPFHKKKQDLKREKYVLVYIIVCVWLCEGWQGANPGWTPQFFHPRENLFFPTLRQRKGWCNTVNVCVYVYIHIFTSICVREKWCYVREKLSFVREKWCFVREKWSFFPGAGGRLHNPQTKKRKIKNAKSASITSRSSLGGTLVRVLNKMISRPFLKIPNGSCVLQCVLQCMGVKQDDIEALLEDPKRFVRVAVCVAVYGC